MKLSQSRYFRTLPALLCVTLLVLVWFLLSDPHDTQQDLTFPSPQSVWAALGRQPGVWFDGALATGGRVLAGLTLGVALGLVGGLILALDRRLTDIAHPVIELIRPLPVVALIPLFIFWFGLGNATQILLVTIGCAMTLLLNTLGAVRTVPAVYLRAAVVFGASRRQLLSTVLFPAIAPATFSGIRIAAGLAFGLAVAGELMGAQSGLGYMVNNARRNLGSDVILAGLILIGIESMILDGVIRAAAKWICRWNDDALQVLQSSGRLPGAVADERVKT